ncbi:NACHT domain-containing protein [Streptomyces ehimensis]|uniref:NACHT domain-containing protein n=1 Tax=Streptomyces ehimensis TaxID=68195 RepID=A0ABV9BWD9_9ACTN
MRFRWGTTWVLCAALTAALVLMWRADDHAADTASAIVAAVVGLFAALAVWAERRTPERRRLRSSTTQLADAQAALARLVTLQWREEALLRQLFDPAPLPVSWSDCPCLADHREVTGGPVTCRADRTEELAARFRALPRSRLVVLGPAGSGKTTLAILLTLGLLRTRGDDGPVPVLTSLASFDPARESAREWLARRIAADYPALADTAVYGPTAIEDLLAAHQVLPVLDGLDELPPPAWPTVLAALDATLDADAPLVLTCRTAAYADAVAEAGVLAGAAVIEPAPVRPADAFAMLRVATPPGPRQQGWDLLVENVFRHPEGGAAQALTSPLMVALARAVYADTAHDPAELADRARFPTRDAVEAHLLDALVPSLYARAQRQDPQRRWDPERARRYFAYLAGAMQRHSTYDLAWWQLYRWTPVLARRWTRALLGGLLAAGLTLAAYVLYCLTTDAPQWSAPVVYWYAIGLAPAVGSMLYAAGQTRSLPLLALYGALGNLTPVFEVQLIHGFWAPHTPVYVLEGLGLYGFGFLVVLYGVGPPTPPEAPSRGELGLRHWRRHLPRTVITVLASAAITALVVTLYVRTRVAWPAGRPVKAFIAEGSAWAYGLEIGALFGVALATLHWVRRPASTQALMTPASSLRADRLVALVTTATAAVLLALPDLVISLTHLSVAPAGSETATLVNYLTGELPIVGAGGLTLALAGRAWPHYTAARFLLAVQGRLPWHLQEFLEDAHRLGLLRQVGTVYQFRHARVQRTLAEN